MMNGYTPTAKQWAKRTIWAM